MKTVKSWFRWSVVASFLAVVVLAVAARAADMRTVAVVSIADLDTAVKALKTVTTQAGYPDAMAQAEATLSALQGFDLKQPIGIVVQADDESFGGYAFLPISDISAMPGLTDMVAMGEKQSDGSVLLPQMSPFMPQIYIKQSGKWAFVSIKELPKNLPADPVKLLEGMDKQYLLGVKANVANLPKELCVDALNGIRAMAEMNAQTEEDLEAIGASFDQIETAMNELKTVNFGIAVTPQNDIVIETAAEAVAGSVMAADMASMAAFKTGQIGFYQPKDSIVAFIGAGVLNAMIKQQYVAQIDKFFEGAREGVEEGDLGKDEMTAAMSVLDNVEAMIKSTIESGKVDIGVTWQKNATLLAGAAITDGNKLQKALEESLVAVPEEFRQYVKINAEQFEGFAVSTIAVPTSILPQEGMSKDLASRTMTLQIAIKDTAIALAFGLDDTVLADLKKAITASKTPASIPETAFVFAPGNLVDFLTLIGPTEGDENYDQVMTVIRACPADAQISGSATFSATGQKSKIVVDNRLLPTCGEFVKMMIEAQNAARDAARRYYENNGDDEIDIDEFDL